MVFSSLSTYCLVDEPLNLSSLLVSTHWLHSVHCNREHCDVLRYDGAVYVLGGFSRGGNTRALLTKTALLLVTHVRY